MINKESLIISDSKTAREALQHINDAAIPNGVLFIVSNENKLIGTLTDGDIRRGLLNEKSINDNVSVFMNKNFKFFSSFKNNFEESIAYKKAGIKFVPVLNNESKLIKIIDLDTTNSILPVEAILMAGGRGERLKPLTDNIPKPMLKIGNKPIVEYNLDRLIENGITEFYLSINYLGEQIENYFKNGENKGVSISYIREDKPMGTIGSVSKISDLINKEYILLMNSDLLTNIDFADLYKKFFESNSDMIVATIPYHVDVPYAVMEINKSEEVISFKEKPRYTYYSNAGIYLFKKELINLIPTNEKFDATHFMEKIIAEKKKLISYPVLGYWLDIGRMDDYYKAQEDINHIKF